MTGIAPGATIVSTVGTLACAGSETAMQCWGTGVLGDGSGTTPDATPPVEVHFDWN
jgi:hypothetical protein